MSSASAHRCRRMFSLIVVVSAAVGGHPRVAGQQPMPFEQAWDAGTPVSVTGIVRLLYVDDFEDRRSELIHMLRDERTGQEFRLRFERGAPPLRTGARLTARGRAGGSTIYLAADGGSTLSIEAAGVMEEASPVTGDQKTLVIVADFVDKPLDPLVPGADCSTAAIRDRMFSDPSGYSVAQMYRETSGGKVSFSGDVAGPYTINFSSTDACDLGAWSQAADALARTNGVDTTAYRRTVYVMPSNRCSGSGIGELGTSPSRAWVFTCDLPRTYAHELGHNLGMHHAATPANEYGDDSDPMGSMGKLKAVNAPHKTQLGWLSESQVATVTADGEYTLAPLASEPAAVGPTVLRIPVAGFDEHYYVSYRTPSTRFESNVPDPYLNRVTVHRWAGGTERTYLLAMLGDGERWTDATSGLIVTQVSHDAAAAVVAVRFGDGCSRAVPTLSLSPPAQSGPAGRPVNFTLSVINNDAPACQPADFSLTTALPTGWTGSLSVGSLHLDAGSAGSATLLVAAPSGTAPDSYRIGVMLSDSLDSLHNAAITGSYSVLAGDAEPPAAPEGLTAKTKGRDVSLSWSGGVDNVGVESYRVWRNGVLLASTPHSSWLDRSVSSGNTYTYSITAVDGAGNVSNPSNPVSVQVGGKRR